MYNGLAKICQMFLDIAKKKEKKKKTQKFRHSNIRTFEMPKKLKNLDIQKFSMINTHNVIMNHTTC